MGCASSREARLEGQAAGLQRRSYSLPVRSSFSGPLYKTSLGDSHHGPTSASFTDEGMMKSSNDGFVPPEILYDEILKAKAWSASVPRSSARTPSVTPPNEPEVINAWELMEGLEDAGTPLFTLAPPSFSFGSAVQDTLTDATKPQWMQAGAQEPVISDFDPEILSSFRMAMDDDLTSPEPEKMSDESVESGDACEGSKVSGIVKARIRDFQQKIDAKRAKSKLNAAKVVSCYESPPESKRRVVFYFTSIRGVRKTYEECWTVRLILKGYGVRVDERDISMHSGFKDELNEILGAGFGGNSLPRVFADGIYLGGAEEVRQLHENGELGKLVESCEVLPVGKGGLEVACEGCADVRFVPCETCSGSCKVFVEEFYEDVEETEEFGSFQRCPDCNENGLVRCPLCC